MKDFINWKIFFVLLVLSLVSVAGAFPYVLTIQADVIKQIDLPVELIFIAQFIQSIIFFSVAIIFGLFFSNRIGFKLPLIEAIVNKGDYKSVLKDILGKSVLFGIIVSIAIYVVDIFFTFLGANITTHESYAPIWQKLLASLYGGSTEEILMRLFLMAFFIWVSLKIFRQSKPTNIGIIISIFLAAVIFGLGHLPLTASVVEINTLIVVRAIVLNGIGGVVFGWLFWKKGLESAMIAHFTADVFLLTILPLLFS